MVVGECLVLKLIRKVASGVHPELEMSAYLTEAGYPNISPLLGSMIRHDAEGQDKVADAADLVAKLKAGKGHPAVKASEDDTKALVKWVLAL